MKVFFFENVHYYKATPYLSNLLSLFQGKEREKKFHFQLKSSNLDKAHKKVSSMVSEKAGHFSKQKLKYSCLS